MGFDAQDKEIVRLLTKLKETDGKYPPDLFAARRQSYVKRMGEVSMDLGAGLKIKNALNNVKTPTFSSATNYVLESALLVAIVAETGTVAYFYRDQLAGFVKKVIGQAYVQQVTPSPALVEQEIQGVTPSRAVPSTLPSVTLSASPTEPEATITPIPEVVNDDNPSNTQTSITLSAQSTPAPDEDNGHHYGQTPKPERTKEATGNNDQASKDDPKPTKDNSRPTQTK